MTVQAVDAPEERDMSFAQPERAVLHLGEGSLDGELHLLLFS